MSKRYMLLSLVLILAALAGIALRYAELPAVVPVHWNVAGQADGYGPRWIVWLLGPGLMSLVLLLGLALPWMSPRQFDLRGFEATYSYLIFVLVALLGYIQALALAAMLGGGISMQRAVPAGLFVLLILVGNPLGKVRRNFFIGIRTPWTLADERVWYATHRLAARVMVASGLLGLLALWAHAPQLIIMTLNLGWVAIPVLYSLVCYKRLERRDH